MGRFHGASGTPSNFAGHPCRGSDERKQRAPFSGARLAGSRVLVVEDEFIIALEIQASLEEAGAVVIGPAFTLSSALELAMKEKLSAATLDMRLGRDPVSPVAHILDQRHVPFVFYTGQPAGDPIRRAWPDSRTLSKPASGDEIVKAVAEIIRTTH